MGGGVGGGVGVRGGWRSGNNIGLWSSTQSDV